METKQEVEQFQNLWAQTIMDIGEAYEKEEDFKSLAKSAVEDLYCYQERNVFFKPTLASETPFRNSPEGALSYFIGDDKNFAEDKGFALNCWKKIEFENNLFDIKNDEVIVNGIYTFFKSDGSSTRALYTFGLAKIRGAWKIWMQHSSL